MQIQVWISLLSLLGVALGGGLSYLAQVHAQRRSERRDDRRRADDLAEARRAERLELLRAFIRHAQQAERAAEEPDGTPAWKASALQALDDLWVYERMIHVLFPANLHDLARQYLRALDDVVWQKAGKVQPGEYLRPSKRAFLDAAREAMTG
jgi:hypothetical protein